MDRATLEGRLRAAFPEAEVTLTDLAGDDDHWAAHIVCASFAGMSRVARHRAVYAAIGDDMGGALHALQLTTGVPS